MFYKTWQERNHNSKRDIFCFDRLTKFPDKIICVASKIRIKLLLKHFRNLFEFCYKSMTSWNNFCCFWCSFDLKKSPDNVFNHHGRKWGCCCLWWSKSWVRKPKNHCQICLKIWFCYFRQFVNFLLFKFDVICIC